MWKKFPPTDWRSIDPVAFNYFSTLLSSRVNLFLYGLDGIGKTKFAKKWLDENNISFWYVDCLEYYNEKLICYTLSRQLSLMDTSLRESKTFATLKDNLQSQWVENPMYRDKPVYFVLDNVNRLISIEKQKKNLEKIFIISDMLAPYVSILIIHDTYIDEWDSFGKSLLNDYNFTPFVLTPMDMETMKKVVKEKYFKKFSDDPNKDKFDFFINFAMSNFNKNSVNIRKWIFLTKALFKVYWEESMNIAQFKALMSHVSTHFYSNLIDVKDIKEEMKRAAEDEENQKVDGMAHAKNDPLSIKKSVAFRPRRVTYYDEMKVGNKASYTFIEAMILLSGYLAANNKEASDIDNFAFWRKAKKKGHRIANKGEEKHQIYHMELGKTKKFSIERLLSILQYFIANFCNEWEEEKLYHHSINVYSKINSFVTENLFKRSQGRNEDPSTISLKINYDHIFIEEVMRQYPLIKKEDFEIKS
jgi:hypothetical protein